MSVPPLRLHRMATPPGVPCRRFTVAGQDGLLVCRSEQTGHGPVSWRAQGTRNTILAWLTAHGLLHEQFCRRRDLLDVLAAHLASDPPGRPVRPAGSRLIRDPAAQDGSYRTADGMFAVRRRAGTGGEPWQLTCPTGVQLPATTIPEAQRIIYAMAPRRPA